jgi:hypothetical protein
MHGVNLFNRPVAHRFLKVVDNTIDRLSRFATIATEKSIAQTVAPSLTAKSDSEPGPDATL